MFGVESQSPACSAASPASSCLREAHRPPGPHGLAHAGVDPCSPPCAGKIAQTSLTSCQDRTHQARVAVQWRGRSRGGGGPSLSPLPGGPPGEPTGRPWGALAGSSGMDGLCREAPEAGPAVSQRGGWPDTKPVATEPCPPVGLRSHCPLPLARCHVLPAPLAGARELPPHRNPRTDSQETGRGPGLPAKPEASYSEQGQDG